MRKVFVCSPLRGADGEPAPTNIALARRLMRAVFDAGHAPFVPHLLFPQILTETETDLNIAFTANFTWLAACNEIWVWARHIGECSQGMKAEIDGPGLRYRPKVLWMPPPFVQAEFEGWRAERAGKPGAVPDGVPPKYLRGLGDVPGLSLLIASGTRLASPFRAHSAKGTCVMCRGVERELDRAGWCLECFTRGRAP